MAITAACALFALLAATSIIIVTAGPLNVRIETEGNQDFHIGPEPRTRFDLVEEYRPLSQAIHSKHARALASSLSKPRQAVRPQPVHVLVDIGALDQQKAEGGAGQPAAGLGRDLQQVAGEPSTELPRVITKSQWLDWTRWSRCENGERVRIRKCLSIRGVPCEGASIEKQNCFSAVSSGIKFAKDPTIIEREIRGDATKGSRARKH